MALGRIKFKEAPSRPFSHNLKILGLYDASCLLLTADKSVSRPYRDDSSIALGSVRTHFRLPVSWIRAIEMAILKTSPFYFFVLNELQFLHLACFIRFQKLLGIKVATSVQPHADWSEEDLSTSELFLRASFKVNTDPYLNGCR